MRGRGLLAYGSLQPLYAIFLAGAGLAHGPIHEQIDALTRQIAEDPCEAQLYLKRGELHRAHRDWALALEDYDQAADLDPGLSAVDLCRGQMLVDAGRYDAAESVLDRFLARHAGNALALELRARAKARLERPLEAAADLTLAIQNRKTPRPQTYLARARVLAAAGGAHLEEALRGLDEGMARLGPSLLLQRYAIELEVQRKGYAAALARLDLLPQGLAESPPWRIRRAEILSAAGRSEEARRVYRGVLEAMEALPPPQGQTDQNQELAARARAGLSQEAKGGQEPERPSSPTKKEEPE